MWHGRVGKRLCTVDILVGTLLEEAAVGVWYAHHFREHLRPTKLLSLVFVGSSVGTTTWVWLNYRRHKTCVRVTLGAPTGHDCSLKLYIFFGCVVVGHRLCPGRRPARVWFCPRGQQKHQWCQDWAVRLYLQRATAPPIYRYIFVRGLCFFSLPGTSCALLMQVPLEWRSKSDFAPNCFGASTDVFEALSVGHIPSPKPKIKN